MKFISRENKNRWFYVFTIIYFLGNLIFLTKFPFVHSDESWLSGLSRNILETGSYKVTETFFDLYPRYPHAIKSVFHSLQIIFIKILGYEIFTVRLISLIFGMLSLYYFYKLCKLVIRTEKMAFLGVILLSLDVQFIYASHFGRQEIVILFIFIYALNYYFVNLKSHSLKNDLILGGIIGTSIGVHPNSFIVCIPFGLMYLHHILGNKKLKLKSLICYGLVVVVFAVSFVAISLSLNSNFFQDYFSFGEQFGVGEPVLAKLLQIKHFYFKIYYGISGTYYTPNIRFQLILFTIVFIVVLVRLIFSNDEERGRVIPLILCIIGVNMGIVLIGRYNQTSVIFQFPLFYILLVYILENMGNRWHRRVTCILLVFIISYSSVKSVVPYMDNSYNRYLNEISKHVTKDSVVLANLNSEFYFNNGVLYDYRNLAYLKDNGLSFGEYIRKNNIEYIIYPEEMDFIYEESPKWDALYGSVSEYYVDMLKFFQEECELVYEFKDKTYGMRIARYVNQKDWTIKIFKIK